MELTMEFIMEEIKKIQEGNQDYPIVECSFCTNKYVVIINECLMCSACLFDYIEIEGI